MNIYIKNSGSQSVKVKVWKDTGIQPGLIRSTKTIEAGSSASWNVGTSSGGKYVISFTAPCTVSGTVSNGG